MNSNRLLHLFRPGLLLFTLLRVGWGQTNPGDLSAMYSVNYSSADRKQTLQPGFVGPSAFTYRPNCRVMAGVDDDTFLSNKTATGWDTGTGFEGHLTLWRGYRLLGKGKCAAGKLTSLTLDYVATVPVRGTLEGTELNHQTKVTWNHPLGGGDVGNIFPERGIQRAENPDQRDRHQCHRECELSPLFKSGGAWDGVAEVDFTSTSKLGPTSVVVLYGIDGTFDKNQTWTFRIGASPA